MKKFSTRTLILLALLTALSVVLTRLLSIQITESLRISLGNLPILLAGCLMGPFAGALTGLAADVLGATLLSPLGWYPPLAVSPVMTGLLSGLLTTCLLQKQDFWRYLLLALLCNTAGPILWTTSWLTRLYGLEFLPLFAVRSPLYLCMTVVEALLLRPLSQLLRKQYFHVSDMTYDEALAYIHGIYWRGSKLGLSRTRELLALLGNPQDRLKFVHVAGTNGKGSTAAMIAQALQCAGYRVGLYTSPFILRFNERMRVNGEPVTDAQLARLTARVKPYAESMKDLPTEFELITAIGMAYFLEQRCDIVVLEVGLGGELDSTNVIRTPEAAVITAIGLDHTRELGDTIEQIAAAKAGIVKENGDVVFYGQNDAAAGVIQSACAQRHARLYFPALPENIRLQPDLGGQTFDCGGRRALRLPLLGTYQPYNAALAIRTLELLAEKGWHIPDSAIADGLSQTVWQGRFEVLCRNPFVVLDGGHNPHGVRATVDSMRAWFPGRRIVCVIGVMADKDVDAILGILSGISDTYCTVQPDNKRAMPAGELAGRIAARGGKAEAFASVSEGVAAALRLAGADGVVLAVGSLYMSADICACFQADAAIASSKFERRTPTC